MKLDLGPLLPTKAKPAATPQAYVAPSFGGADAKTMDAGLEHRMRRPMIIGAGVIGVFVVALGGWASLFPIATGVNAPAEVRVEANRKTIRVREGGTVREILVKEGQLVRANQPMILFNDVEARAAFDVYQNQHDTLIAQSARFTAEATNSSVIRFDPELLARASDPRVAGLIRDQQFLFTSRRQLFDSQTAVLGQRLEQLQTQIGGQEGQIASVDEQRRLTEEELAGYRTLNEKGFAPKTLILRYERSLAELGARKGSLVADVARLGQQMGETRLQMSSIREERESQAAEGLRDTQSRLADVGPRFTAAKQALEATVVRAPVDGYVFNLTQFTVGAATAPGEVLMDVVPSGAPMMVTALIAPQDIEQVHQGMDARVRLIGLNQRFNDDLPAKVAVVSADATTNERTGISTYRVDLRIDPKDLTKLKRGVKLTPGMPAEALIVTGKRTVMSFLISPITDTLQDAFREE
jgi:HlyD family type I secretion membrane fusion protein